MGNRLKYILVAAVILTIAIAWWLKSHPKNIGVIPPIAATQCQGTACDRVAYIDKNGNLTDESGASLRGLDLKVGTRVCFFNRAGCTVTLKCPDELFGAALATASIDSAGCVNQTVSSEARSQTLLFEVVSACPAEGTGHTNPEARVGDEDEGGH